MENRYGTKEYWEEEIRAKELDKKIYVHAINNVAGQEDMDFELLDRIAGRINSCNEYIGWCKNELAKLEQGE